MLRHLLEMIPASNVSGPGRDSAINLLVKQVPRKSLKNPDNSLALWVIDQGMKTTFMSSNILVILKLTDAGQTSSTWPVFDINGHLVSPAGLKKILQVAGTVPELSQGPPLTDNTHMSCSVLLSKLYDDLNSDKERENFNKLCEEYVQ